MINTDIKIGAMICTRSENLSSTTKALVSYLSRAKVAVKLLVNKKSIFEAYNQGLNLFKEDGFGPDDVLILCHDDIEIFNDPNHLRRLMFEVSLNPEIGFVGPAGTTYLGEDATWWNHENWGKGLHSGFVMHGDPYKIDTTYYGNYQEVVVLDGLFLASPVRVLEKIGLDKPETFEGLWDFYDLEYTMKARARGYKNYTKPILLRHESFGALAGRDSWIKNKIAFTEKWHPPVKL